MKILYVALFDVKSCGPTEVIKAIVPFLIRKGIQIDILSPYPYREDKKKLASEIGCSYYFMCDSFINKSSFNKIRLDIESYDCVHIHGIYEPHNWMIAKLLSDKNVPYVVSTHGNLMQNALKKSKIKKAIAIKLAIKRMLENASVIHALAENEKNDILKVVKNKIVVIPNGIFAFLENVSQKKSEKIEMLFLGRIDINHKGLDYLFNAIMKLDDLILGKVHFTIAGPIADKRTKNIFEKYFLNDKVSKSVSYVGPAYDEEKEKLFRKATCFIHLSRYEGMPVAVLEALSRGVMCLVSKETNMEDIIIKCNGGYVVDLDVDKISDFIKKFVNNELLCKKVDINWVKTNMSWDNISNKYLEMYKSII